MAFSAWKDSPQDNAADLWFTPGRFAFLLALLVAATFPAVLAGDTFVYRDFGYVTIPFAKYVRDSYWQGEIPLWNPLSMCGLPFLGQWGTQPLYPPALFYVLFPFVWAVNFFCLAHMVVGGVGMHRLVTHWTNDRFAGCVAGVAYAFSAVFLNCLTWVHTASALGWMPWVVLAMERAWHGNRRTMLMAVLAGTMQMLTGSPEIIVQTWLIIGVLGGARWAHDRWTKTGNSFTIPVTMLGVVLLVAALAAVQLLPFLDMLAHSQRTGNYGGSAWAMPASGWANLLVPLYNSQLADSGVWGQKDQYWISCYYLGAGVLVLGVYTLWKIRQPQVWLFAAMILISLIMALGDNSPIYGWIRKVVPLGFMRYPVKFVVAAAFLLPLLAAFAVTRFEFSVNPPRRSRSIMVISGIAVAAICLILWRAHVEQLPYSPWEAIWKNGASRALLLLLFVTLIISLPKTTFAPARSALKLVILMVLWIDLITHAPKAFPVVDALVFAPGLAEKQLSKVPKLGESRVMLRAEANYLLYSRMISDPTKDFLVHRAGFFSNCNLLDGLPKVDGFNSLYPREIFETLAPIYMYTNGYPPKLADFMGVSQLTVSGEVFQWQSRTSNLPIISAGQKPVFADQATTLRELHEPTFDGAQMVYLPPETKAAITAVPSPDAKVSDVDFRAHRVTANVETPQPALVVVAQSYYHWWKARVNGNLVPVWQANYGFQALQVPAGKSTVELVYDDSFFKAGAVVSLAALVLWGILWRSKPGNPAVSH